MERAARCFDVDWRIGSFRIFRHPRVGHFPLFKIASFEHY